MGYKRRTMYLMNFNVTTPAGMIVDIRLVGCCVVLCRDRIGEEDGLEGCLGGRIGRVRYCINECFPSLPQPVRRTVRCPQPVRRICCSVTKLTRKILYFKAF